MGEKEFREGEVEEKVRRWKNGRGGRDDDEKKATKESGRCGMREGGKER